MNSAFQLVMVIASAAALGYFAAVQFICELTVTPYEWIGVAMVLLIFLKMFLSNITINEDKIDNP